VSSEEILSSRDDQRMTGSGTVVLDGARRSRRRWKGEIDYGEKVEGVGEDRKKGMSRLIGTE